MKKYTIIIEVYDSLLANNTLAEIAHQAGVEISEPLKTEKHDIFRVEVSADDVIFLYSFGVQMGDLYYPNLPKLELDAYSKK